MTGIENIFDKEVLYAKEDDDKIVFNTDNKYYLIDFENENGMISNFSQSYSEFYLDKESGINEVSIYTLNEDKLKEIYDKLSSNQISYTHYSDSLIEGEIEVGENQIIFTSIPYDEAWHVYIDGKEVETLSVLEEALLAVECGVGKHQIKLEYKVDYNKPLTISLVTFSILVVYSIIKNM